MRTKRCSWGLCKSDSRYPDKLPDGIQFIPFPKPGFMKMKMTEKERERETQKTEKSKRWLFLCGREDFKTLDQINSNRYVCTLHFQSLSGPTLQNPDPFSASLTERELEAKLRLKRKSPPVRSNTTKKIKFEETNQGPSTSKYTQTVYENYMLGAKIENMILKNKVITGIRNENNVKSLDNPFSPEAVLKEDKKTKFLIGLYPDQFYILYHALGPAKFNLTYWKGEKKSINLKTKDSKTKRHFTPKEEMFITLLKLKRGFTHQTIAYTFNVSKTLVTRIFITWIQFLYLHFKELDIFPSRDFFKENLPKVFRPFRNIRCVIDCTEFSCESPLNYAHQGNLYSSYKHHTTLKALIAVAPNGAACFISDMYEGSIDDVEITKKSGFLDYIQPGDLILGDRGFTIQELLHRKQAQIKIPAFLGKRDKLTRGEEMDTRRIAKARIHIERFNGRLKKFQLINKTIPLSLIPIASQLIYVASCLVNFQQPLCR